MANELKTTKLHLTTETITRLVFLTAWELANRDERIVVDKPTKK